MVNILVYCPWAMFVAKPQQLKNASFKTLLFDYSMTHPGLFLSFTAEKKIAKCFALNEGNNTWPVHSV